MRNETERSASEARELCSAPNPLARQQQLFRRLRSLKSLLVAFSGGTDSAYLAWAAHQMLGKNALAVTALSPSFSAHDRRQAESFVREVGLCHEFIETREFENPLYLANNPDRCYHCKIELFSELARLAAARDFAAVAYGANADDLRDFRPGHRAAAEYGVLAPLLEVRLSKAEIRELSRRAGLSSWDRPSASCLSSRVPYGTPITADNLTPIEQAENILRQLGFRQFRVRSHQDLARIEIAPAELPRALHLEVARSLAEHIKRLGFSYVTLDLEGYRQGSMNAALKKK